MSIFKRYRIVEVDPGKYALERTLGICPLCFRVYKDVTNFYYWWPSSSVFFEDCVTEDLDYLLSLLRRFEHRFKEVDVSGCR